MVDIPVQWRDYRASLDLRPIIFREPSHTREQHRRKMKSLITAILGGAACWIIATARTVVVEHAFGPEAKVSSIASADCVLR